MNDFIQHIILPATTGGDVILIAQVESNESKTSVSLVTADNRKPKVKATIERVLVHYPFAKRIRVMCPTDLGLVARYTFKLIGGTWVEQAPAPRRSIRRISSLEQREFVLNLLLGATEPTNSD